MRKALLAAIGLLLAVELVAAMDVSGLRLYRMSEHFTIYTEDAADYHELIASLETQYTRLREKYRLSFDDRIEVYIYKDQMSFLSKVFGWETVEMNVAGFADYVNRRLFITTIYDPCKPKEHMRKMPLHELTHVLLPSDHVWIREGIAYYESGMLQDFTLAELPDRIAALPFYKGDEGTAVAYNLSGWMTRYIIEELLASDAQGYLRFMRAPEDFTRIGLRNESEFISKWKEYMKKQTGYRESARLP